MPELLESPPTADDAKLTAESEAGTLFTDLPLSNEVQLSVQMAGYVSPTDIQASIIPHVLEGRDIVAQSQTGTGKTAAFALPLLSRIDVHARSPQVLVLAPTRELATQVAKSFETYGACISKLRIGAIYGGADYEPQLRMLKKGVQVVVGTPGRVLDHIKRGTLKLDSIQTLVLDEADEMLNMGFIEDVEFVLKQTPANKQVALFSATLPGPIREIAKRHLTDPESITIKKKTLTAESIDQRCIFVDEYNKRELLARLLEVEETDGVVIFTKTKESTLAVSEHLTELGFNADALNGDLPQSRRQRTVDQLKSGKLDVLVATDVAARGLDVQRISHVFNYDLPHDGESYVHRIGRTGRAGKTGVAYIFLTHRQRSKLRLIERLTKQPIQVLQPPTAREINIARVARFKRHIADAAAAKDLSVYQNIIAEYVGETEQPIELVAAALAHLAQGGRPLLVKDLPKLQPPSGKDRATRKGGSPQEGRRRRAGQGPESHMRRYWIAVGYSDGVKPGNIVGAVANEAGISGQDIGPIEIRDNYSTIDLPKELSRERLAVLQGAWVAGKQLRLRPFQAQAGARSGKGGPRRNRKQDSAPFKKSPGGAARHSSKPGRRRAKSS